MSRFIGRSPRWPVNPGQSSGTSWVLSEVLHAVLGVAVAATSGRCSPITSAALMNGSAPWSPGRSTTAPTPTASVVKAAAVVGIANRGCPLRCRRRPVGGVQPDHIRVADERVRTRLLAVVIGHRHTNLLPLVWFPVHRRRTVRALPELVNQCGAVRVYAARTAVAHLTCSHGYGASRPHRSRHPQHKPPASEVCWRNTSAAAASVRPIASRTTASASTGISRPVRPTGQPRSRGPQRRACAPVRVRRTPSGAGHAQLNPPAPRRRAPTSSGRVVPGRRRGSRSVREKATTAVSRLWQGPGVPHLRHRPLALEVMCMSRVRCAAANCSSAVVA